MMIYFFIFFITLLVTSCTTQTNILLYQKNYKDLNGWNSEDHSQILKIYSQNCSLLQKKNFDNFKFANNSKCEVAKNYSGNAKDFFESNFTPYLVTNNQKNYGLFTGYYEIALNASFKRQGKFIYPIYKKPPDLNPNQKYYTRKDIENGALESKGLEIAYTDDPIKLFFLHIQGSGMLLLDNGDKIRIGYDAQNGHKYYSIGKYLWKIEKIDRSKLNAKFIIEYLKYYNFKSKEIMNQNKSYVFFKLGRTNPIGALGSQVIKERSLAVDNKFIPLGSLVWLETTYPLEIKKEDFRKLMIANDTGGAIKGPIRGDIFYGIGEDAEKKAFYMKNFGKYFILIPNIEGKFIYNF